MIKKSYSSILTSLANFLIILRKATVFVREKFWITEDFRILYAEDFVDQIRRYNDWVEGVLIILTRIISPKNILHTVEKLKLPFQQYARKTSKFTESWSCISHKGGVFSKVKVKSRHDHDFRRTANV